MKLVLLSDIHLLWDKPRARLDDAKETQLRKLEFVLEYADRNGGIILQSGDIFDSPRSYRVLGSAIALFRKHCHTKIYSVFGQHDTYLYNENTRSHTSLGILEVAKLVQVLGPQPAFIQGICRLWGCSYGASIPAADNKYDLKILVIHAMISAGPMWVGQQDYSVAKDFLKKHKRYDLTLCGDAHQKFLFKDGKRIICNSGPLLRREASKEMWEHKPGFWVYDTETQDIEWVEIPHEPAEKVLTRAHIEDRQEMSQMLKEFIEAIKIGVPKGLSLRDNLLRLMQDSDIESEVRAILSEVTNGEV